MRNRVLALTLFALVLSGCDLLKVASASPAPAGAGSTFEPVGTIAPSGTGAGDAGFGKGTDIFGGTPSPSAIASPSPSPSPSFVPTAPSAPPTTAAPTIRIVLPTPTPSPSPSPTIARPTITSFVPESGLRGSIVTITGTNLASVTLVLFGDVATAPKSPPTATTVVATVPFTAVSAPISLVSPSGVVTSTRFFIVEEPAPPTPTPCPFRAQCPPSPSPSTTP